MLKALIIMVAVMCTGHALNAPVGSTTVESYSEEEPLLDIEEEEDILETPRYSKEYLEELEFNSQMNNW